MVRLGRRVPLALSARPVRPVQTESRVFRAIQVQLARPEHKELWEPPVLELRGPPGATGPQGIPGTPGSSPSGLSLVGGGTGINTLSASISTNWYMSTFDSIFTNVGNEVSIMMPVSGTISNLTIRVFGQVALDPTYGWRFAVWTDSGDTVVTCDLLGEARQCSDAAHSVCLPAGSKLAVHASAIGAAPIQRGRWAAAFTPGACS